MNKLHPPAESSCTDLLALPAKQVWNDLNPLGRALFFVPATICLYAMMAVLVSVLYPFCWFEQTVAVKWISEKLKALFGL